jgi:hypothetical protein
MSDALVNNTGVRVLPSKLELQDYLFQITVSILITDVMLCLTLQYRNMV